MLTLSSNRPIQKHISQLIDTLRHTHESQLLDAGVSLADVSRRLGHSNVYVTATVYSNAISGNDADVARKWEAFQKSAAATAGGGASAAAGAAEPSTNCDPN